MSNIEKNDLVLAKKVSMWNDKYSFLDDLNATLAFPKLFVSLGESTLQPMYMNYWNSLPLFVQGEEPMDIRDLADGLSRFHEPELKNKNDYDHSFVWITQYDKKGIPQKTINFSRIAMVKSMLYDFISILNYEVPLRDLHKSAEQGNEECLLKLIRIDKSAVYTDWCKIFILKKQYTADWEFFERLGQAIKAKPFDTKKAIPKAIIIVAKLWDNYFRKMTYPKAVALLEKHKVLPKNTDPFTFSKTLNRLGLKKTKYNKK